LLRRSYASELSTYRSLYLSRDAATSLINQRLLFTGTEAHKLQSLRQILTSAPLSSLSSSSTAPAFTFQPPCLIFVQSIPRANDLFHELVYDGLHVDVIHSERTPAERERVVKEFREGRVWVLVTTELMGRGMDFRGINLVVNYDFPTSVQSYVHRIGESSAPSARIASTRKADECRFSSRSNWSCWQVGRGHHLLHQRRRPLPQNVRLLFSLRFPDGNRRAHASSFPF
jgi:superfamily II DNA/RNA helicase